MSLKDSLIKVSLVEENGRIIKTFKTSIKTNDFNPKLVMKQFFYKDSCLWRVKIYTVNPCDKALGQASNDKNLLGLKFQPQSKAQRSNYKSKRPVSITAPSGRIRVGFLIIECMTQDFFF